MLCALPVSVLAMINTQSAIGFEGSLRFDPFEPTSTLGAHVPSQDLELRKTVLDFVDSGILTGNKSPKFQAPQLSLPTSKSVGNAVAEPTLAAPQPTLAAPLRTSEATQGNVVDKKSPFRKWVRPKSSDADPSSIASDSPTTDSMTTDSVKLDEDEAEPVAPQVARRASTPPKVKEALPLPPPAKQSTAVASDLSINGDELEQDSVRPTTKPKQSSVPQPPSFLTPIADAPGQGVSAGKLPPLTRSQQNLRKKVRRVLTHYYNRPLNTRDRSPWELMHAMLAFEAHSKVLKGGPKGEPITAVGWLCFNQACKRRTLMYVNDDNELRVRVGPALQGHRGQLLAMLAQSRINESYPLLVEGHELQVADLIEMEKRTCYPRTELTFKLIGLMHYLDSDEKWLNDQGLEWGIPKMIEEEIRQPVRGAACGGTHRLSGLTLAYKTREGRGEPVDGQYLRAKKFVTRYQQYAYRLQNRDGSFSTEWFRGPGNEDDVDRKLKTTGHILEWLLYAATEKELKHWRTTKAANYLANIMYNNRYKDWEAGPLGHAIHALLVYDRMVFSPYDTAAQSPMASQPGSSRQPSRKR